VVFGMGGGGGELGGGVVGGWGGGLEGEDTSTWLMLFRRLGKQEKPPTSP